VIIIDEENAFAAPLFAGGCRGGLHRCVCRSRRGIRRSRSAALLCPLDCHGDLTRDAGP
jgi:hypothetical protein